MIFQFPPIGLPGKAWHGGYVYVVEFNTGLVKVGRTQSPQDRLVSYMSHAGAFGAHPTRGWVSPLHEGNRGTEAALVVLAGELGGQSTAREYFNGVAFEEIVARASALSFPAPVPLANPPVRRPPFPVRRIERRRFTARDVESVAYMLAAVDGVHGLEQVEEPTPRHVAAAQAVLAFLDDGGARRLFEGEKPIAAEERWPFFDGLEASA